MKKQINILLIVLSVICSNSINATQKTVINSVDIYLPFSYINNNYSGCGIDNTTTYNLSSSGTNNPATLSDIQKYTFNISYQFESRIPDNWIAGINYKRDRIEYPQNLSFIIPYNDLRVSVGFVQKYNANIDYGVMYGAIIDTTSPLGYIDYPITASKQVYVHSYFFGSSYSFNNFFVKTDKIHIGAQINLNTLEIKQSIESTMPNYISSNQYYNESVSKTNFVFGVNYEIVNKNNVRFKTGFSYQTQTNFSWVGINGGEKFEFAEYLPEQYNLGFEINNINAFDFAVNLSSINWNKISSSENNKLNFSFSSAYNIDDYIKISCGILTQYSKFNSNEFAHKEDFDAYYLIIGGAIKIGMFGIDLSIGDSHLFSGIKARQTIAKTSFIVQF